MTAEQVKRNICWAIDIIDKKMHNIFSIISSNSVLKKNGPNIGRIP